MTGSRERIDASAAVAGDTLRQLHQRGVLQPIDLHLGLLLLRLEPDVPLIGIAAALSSRAVQAGHVCLDLPFFLEQPLLDQDDEPVALAWPTLDEWLRAFEASPLITHQRDPRSDVVLVVDERRRIFLQRYANYQRRLVDALLARARHILPVDEGAALETLDRYFGQAPAELDEQRLAASLALKSALCIISGGPGTGKTTSVGRILLLLQEQARAMDLPARRMLLLAPTGKAAQRLSESLRASLSRSGADPSLLRSLPDSASTIHRALGYSTRTPTRFRRNRENPLAADVVLVDEASMVDLALMTKLVEAVPKSAHLILLGDKDQLASVEAGAIFGDMFTAAGDPGYSEPITSYASRLGNPGLSPKPHTGPLRDCTVHLQKSYRYVEESGIGQLAKALRDADVEAVLRAARSDDATLIHTEDMSESERRVRLAEIIADALRDYPETRDPEARLASLQRFRVLAAHRRGPLGVEGLNRLTEQTLLPLGLNPTEGAYDGRPIMISSNDYQLELFNGDVGVVAQDGPAQRLVAFFPSEACLRRVQLSRLPPH